MNKYALLYPGLEHSEKALMNPDNEWNETLKNHPIFSPPEPPKSPTTEVLSSNTLPRFVKADSLDNGPAPSGRRQTMVLKDVDLIVAVGKEIRMSSLSDTNSTKKSYKVCGSCPRTFSMSRVLIQPCRHSIPQISNLIFTRWY